MSKKRKYVFVFALLMVTYLGIQFSKEVMVSASERTTYDISKGNVDIKKSGNYNLTGSTTEYKVNIKSNAKVNLWINELSIETMTFYEFLAPLHIEKGATLNLIITGDNTITNTGTGNAITVAGGGKLTISKYSTGSLTLNGSNLGSGIGGGGRVVIGGGTINANGGSYGAGIGDSQDLEHLSLQIDGGMLTARGGYTLVEAGSSEINYYSEKYQKPTVCDVCVGSFVITGGNINVTTSTKVPVNARGQKLYQLLFNCDKGSVSKLIVDGKAYGCTNVTSRGYLSLWTVNPSEPNIEVTMSNGKKTVVKEGGYGGIYSLDDGTGMTLDISNGSVELYDNGFIYNNHVYKVRIYEGVVVTVTGTTNRNQIIVHQGDYTLNLKDVTVDYTNQEQSFFIIENQAKVTLNYDGMNTFTTNQDNHAIAIGYQASLSLVSDSEKNTLEFRNTNGYGSIFTANGMLNQYGGTVITEAKETGYGIILGDTGTYHLYGGIYQGKSESAYSIFGHCKISIHVHGGEFIADTIGNKEEGNEEITDASTFLCSGGLVKVSKRMVFGIVFVYGGQINAHILGSGSGTKVTQFAGEIRIDQYITNFDNMEFELIKEDKVNLESAIDVRYLYGGTYQETHKVTVEELKLIDIGRC